MYQVRPKVCLQVLGRIDIPPICGGPGNGTSPQGGFFTVTYLIVYLSLVTAFYFEYAFFNVESVGSLEPSVNVEVDSISIDIHLQVQIIGLQVACASSTNECLPALQLSMAGVTGDAKWTCSVQSEPLACVVSMSCQSCNLHSARAQLSLSVQDEFAFAQMFEWQLSTSWVGGHGEGHLSALVKPPFDSVFRGNQATTVTLSMVPTSYQNHLHAVDVKGFTVQYMSTQDGSIADEASFWQSRGNVVMQFELRSAPEQFTLEVGRTETTLDFFVKVMSTGAGLSFVCRMALWFYNKSHNAMKALTPGGKQKFLHAQSVFLQISNRHKRSYQMHNDDEEAVQQGPRNLQHRYSRTGLPSWSSNSQHTSPRWVSN